ncbi:MAG TPA: Crp/Fnr family transcriptional regulator [Blastocatellia bacterium]|nr:Crp/Fnr family transcriptional regulator [Blastocatellia bacterium]
MGRGRTRTKRRAQEHRQYGRNRVASADPYNWECSSWWERSREFPAGAELFKQGSSAREVYLIEQGLAKLIRVTEDGQEIIVGLRSPGWILGASSAILGNPYSLTAVTLTRCRTRFIYAEQFIELARSDLEFSWYLHILATEELHEQLAHLVGLRCLSARKRFEQLLLLMVSSIHPDLSQNDARFKLPMKQWEIAQLIGITPEHLCRLQRQMEQEGLLHRENGWLIIYDLDRLYNPEEL